MHANLDQACCRNRAAPRLGGSRLSSRLQRCWRWPLVEQTRQRARKALLAGESQGSLGARTGSLGARRSLARRAEVKARTPGIAEEVKYITCASRPDEPGRQATLEHQALAQLTRPRSRVPSFSGLSAWRCAAAMTRQRLDTMSIGFFGELKKAGFPARAIYSGGGAKSTAIRREN